MRGLNRVSMPGKVREQRVGVRVEVRVVPFWAPVEKREEGDLSDFVATICTNMCRAGGRVRSAAHGVVPRDLVLWCRCCQRDAAC